MGVTANAIIRDPLDEKVAGLHLQADSNGPGGLLLRGLLHNVGEGALVGPVVDHVVSHVDLELAGQTGVVGEELRERGRGEELGVWARGAVQYGLIGADLGV